MSKTSTGPKKSSSAKNSKNLVIVESPAKARTIERYLGKDFQVSASMGHVRDLPVSTMGIDLEKDFQPKYQVLPTRRDVVNKLRTAVKGARQIYLATDLDREGEAIAWHLAAALKLPEARTKRVIFNEITKRAIQHAFEHADDIDMDKVNAQQARRILDRLVGYQLSPLLWKNVAKNLSAGRVQSVAVRLIVERERELEKFVPDEYWRVSAILLTDPSAGQTAEAAYKTYEQHCRQTAETRAQKAAEQIAEQSHTQSSSRPNLLDVLKHPATGEPLEVVGIEDPALLKIRTVSGGECQIGRKTVDTSDVQPADASQQARQTPIQIKDEPKKLNAVLEKHQMFRADLIEFDGNAFKVARGEQAADMVSALEGARYVLTSLETKDRAENPSPPFTTATMQRQAATVLNFTTKRTMQAAQELYQGVELGSEGPAALITYMRTDSTHLANDAVRAVRDYIAGDFGAEFVPEKPRFYASSRQAQEAHEAIRPIDVSRRPEDVRQFLTPDQYKLYDLIWQRFVACQMKPALWKITEAMVEARSDDHRGLFKASGRMLAFPGFLAVLPERLNGSDATLPSLTDNQALHLIRLNPAQNFTQPPARFNEASLVRTLEAEGIGRPSTYATIISTIQDRGYTQKRKGPFYPTDLGMVVTDKLMKHFPKIMDVKFTSHMEDQLDKIEEAHLDWVSVLNEFYGPFKEALEHAGENMIKEGGQESEHACQQCGKPMVYRWTKTGRFLACSGYPECKYSSSIDEQGNPIAKEVNLTDHRCPQCEKPMVLRGSRYGSFLGCSGYPECRQTIPCDKSGNPLKKVKPEEITETCDQCGKDMVPRRARGRTFLACKGYPDCKNTKSIPEGIAVEWPEPEVTDVKCEKCGQPMVMRRSRRGPFLGCSGYPKCRSIQPIKKQEDQGEDKDQAKAKTGGRKRTGGKAGGTKQSEQ